MWEKIQEALVAAGRENGKLKRCIVSWAKNVGLRSNLAVMRGSVISGPDPSFRWALRHESDCGPLIHIFAILTLF